MRFLWMAAAAALLLAGCSTKVDPYHRQRGTDSQEQGSGQGGNVTPAKEVKPTENKNWSIKYAGRKDVKGDLLEVIEVNSVPASQQYLVSVINQAGYQTYWENHDNFDQVILAFMEYEAEQNKEYITSGGNPDVVYFDPFRHGTWYAFIIGIDKDGHITGDYAYCKFTVEEEEPLEAYNRWLGQWTVSDGKISYDISISSVESNFIYRVDGWETGNSMDEEMNQEYLETFFERKDGKMYFVSQFIQSYSDTETKEDVDEYFLGSINYDDIQEYPGLYFIPTEGLDLASATLGTEDNAVIQPCPVETTVGKSQYKGVFYSMQYFYTNGDNWYFYNEDIARLPMTMVRKADAQPKPQAPASLRSLGADQDKIRRGKVFVPRSERRAAAAIAR